MSNYVLTRLSLVANNIGKSKSVFGLNYFEFKSKTTFAIKYQAHSWKNFFIFTLLPNTHSKT